MSYTIDWVVDIDATPEEAESIVQKVKAWLIEQEIILPKQPTKGSLSSGPLWPPGAQASKWSHQVEPDWKDCGLEICTTRTVFHAGDNGLDGFRCPACGEKHGADAVPWGDFVQNWWACSGSEMMPCPACNCASSIVDWHFLECEWGLGNLGFGFNNWSIMDSLGEAIANVTRHRCRVVRQHI